MQSAHKSVNVGKAGSRTGREQSIPAIIAAAGDHAIAAYRSFLENPKLSSGTRRVYRVRAGSFFRWAASRDLTLETIDQSAISEYKATIAATKSDHATTVQMSPVRGVLRRLAAAGVLSSDPCPKGQPNGRGSTARSSWEPTVPPGFDLLALMAMLSHMEEESLHRIFKDESVALSLLDQIRWPDEPVCTRCRAADVEMAAASRDLLCQSCGSHFTSITGTMFDESSLALRQWMWLIHRRVLLGDHLSDSDLAGLIDVDAATLGICLVGLESAVAQEGIPSGAALKHVLDAKDRELANDQVARDIIHYGGMTSAREDLIKAKAEDTDVPDLSAGVSLDQALAMLDERISEADRWVYVVEDGYLVRKLAEQTVVVTALPEPQRSDD